MELVGTGSVDDCQDWPCDEIWDNRDQTFYWKEAADWSVIEAQVGQALSDYLAQGQFKHHLTESLFKEFKPALVLVFSHRKTTLKIETLVRWSFNQQLNLNKTKRLTKRLAFVDILAVTKF